MIFGRKPQEPLDYLIFGLGNPGARYAGTRHNLGWWVLDALARRFKPFKTAQQNQGQAEYVRMQDGPLGEAKRVALIKPTTFMNLSGQCVRAWVKSQEGVPWIVVYDDISMAVGKLRLRSTGSAGGHNGVKSLIASLGGQDFERLKIGVGEPLGQMDVADYVLLEPSKSERLSLEEAVERCADALVALACGADMERVRRMLGDSGPQKGDASEAG